jgi:hypothetical protein
MQVLRNHKLVRRIRKQVLRSRKRVLRSTKVLRNRKLVRMKACHSRCRNIECRSHSR